MSMPAPDSGMSHSRVPSSSTRSALWDVTAPGIFSRTCAANVSARISASNPSSSSASNRASVASSVPALTRTSSSVTSMSMLWKGASAPASASTALTSSKGTVIR